MLCGITVDTLITLSVFESETSNLTITRTINIYSQFCENAFYPYILNIEYCGIGQYACLIESDDDPVHCVDPTRVCDGHRDCTNGMDEENCSDIGKQGAHTMKKSISPDIGNQEYRQGMRPTILILVIRGLR